MCLIFLCKYLIAFSVSAVKSFFFGFFSFGNSNPTFQVFIFSRLSFICFKFTNFDILLTVHLNIFILVLTNLMH